MAGAGPIFGWKVPYDSHRGGQDTPETRQSELVPLPDGSRRYNFMHTIVHRIVRGDGDRLDAMQCRFLCSMGGKQCRSWNAKV